MMQQFMETQKLMTTRSFEQLRGQFLNAAKTHALPAWKAIIGTYVLYSDEDERRTFMSFLLSARTMEELVVQHNLHVTNRMADNEAFLAAHHRTLATMTTPLMQTSARSTLRSCRTPPTRATTLPGLAPWPRTSKSRRTAMCRSAVSMST
eukprot:PhM_4_TR1288/c2_g2_i4/m.7482